MIIMATFLSYKVSTKIGTIILVTAMSFCIVSVSSSAFTNSLNEIESIQRAQLNAIQELTGENMDINNTDNWNVYNNTEYGFEVKYPETLAQIKEEDQNTYFEEYSEYSIQPLKISFEKFTIKVWDNSDNLELKKYLVNEEFCEIDKEFCSSFRNSEEISLVKTTVADKDWFQTVNRAQRFFTLSPDNKYILDFELTSLNYKKEFSKIIATLEFRDTIDK